MGKIEVLIQRYSSMAMEKKRIEDEREKITDMLKKKEREIDTLMFKVKAELEEEMKKFGLSFRDINFSGRGIGTTITSPNFWFTNGTTSAQPINYNITTDQLGQQTVNATFITTPAA